MKAAIYFTDAEVKETLEALKVSPARKDQVLAVLLDRTVAVLILALVGAVFSFSSGTFRIR